MDRDKAVCAELIQAWGFARDQGKWDDLEAIFHPGGEIAVSWFGGPYPEFVAHCRRNFGKGSEAKHLLWPARVQRERRARHRRDQRGDPGAPDHRGHRRRSQFERPLSRPAGAARRRLEDGRARGAVREGPARSGRAVAAVRRADGGRGRAKYPAPYRYMAYRVHAAGRTLAEPVHYDGRPETEALKARYADVALGRLEFDPRLKPRRWLCPSSPHSPSKMGTTPGREGPASVGVRDSQSANSERAPLTRNARGPTAPRKRGEVNSMMLKRTHRREFRLAVP